jgi:threonine dehydrogenase-like Zn-dependent dehydrogenase
MKAAVYDGKGSIRFQEVEKPRIGEMDILLKTGAASICGTDIRILKSGHHLLSEGQPRILGHEFAGTVWETGSCVEGFEKGMRVTVGPNVGCGTCRYCRRGYSHICPDLQALGIVRDGGFAEYVRIHSKALDQGNVVPIDEDTPFQEAALAEPLSCCQNALRSVGTRPGDSVLIVGAGPMGMLHLQLQKLAGAAPLMMADISDTRLAMAGRFGPDILINPDKEDLEQIVMENTGGEGADVIITAVPVHAVQQQAVHLASKLGRINLFGGLPKDRSRVELDTNVIHYKGLVVTGTTGASLADLETAVNLIVRKKIDVGSLVSRTYPIEQAEEAFEFAKSGEGLKTLFTFEEQ